MNSRRKGKRGELQWAAFCREHFGIAGARRSQQYRGTVDSQDVLTWPGTHAEVKLVEGLNVEQAMRQAEADAGDGGPVPYVAHRRNRTEWLVTVRARDLSQFCSLVSEAIHRGEAV